MELIRIAEEVIILSITLLPFLLYLIMYALLWLVGPGRETKSKMFSKRFPGSGQRTRPDRVQGRRLGN